MKAVASRVSGGILKSLVFPIDYDVFSLFASWHRMIIQSVCQRNKPNTFPSVLFFKKKKKNARLKICSSCRCLLCATKLFHTLTSKTICIKINVIPHGIL